jgi:hypothetical protein
MEHTQRERRAVGSNADILFISHSAIGIHSCTQEPTYKAASHCSVEATSDSRRKTEQCRGCHQRMKLPRFRGHRTIWVRGVHDVQDETSVHTRVPRQMVELAHAGCSPEELAREFNRRHSRSGTSGAEDPLWPPAERGLQRLRDAFAAGTLGPQVTVAVRGGRHGLSAAEMTGGDQRIERRC